MTEVFSLKKKKKKKKLQIENFYAEDLHAGKGISAFTLKDISTIELKNVVMNKIDGSNYGGVLFTSNEEQIGSEFKVTNGTFTNFHQYQVNEASSFIYSHQNINISLNNCTINNINGFKGYFIYIGSPTKLELNSVKIENHYTTKDCTFIRSRSLSKFDKNILIFNDLYVKGLETVKEFVYIDSGDISINDSYLSNIRSSSINFLIDDDKPKDSYFFRMGLNTNLSINNTRIKSIYTYYGIVSETSSNITLENCSFEYCYFDKSLFRIDPKNNINSKTNFTVNNSNFYIISANDGGVVSIIELDEESMIIFNDCLFEETSTMNYGGVIYSESKLTNTHVFFNNCEFIPEYTDQGSISYSHCIESEPYFSNIDELKIIYDYAFSTNPTKIVLSSESLDYISIFSGESIPSNFDVELYDDYGIRRYIYSDYNTMSFNDLIYFRVVINDTNNAILLGDTISFCKEKCSFPQARVVGNPGNYKLGLILITYGKFQKFENNAVFVDLEIKNCTNEQKYNYKDIEGYGFKSCYKPECSPACVHGKCEDNNQCKCDKYYGGLLCNEPFKLKRILFIDIIIRVVGGILIIIILICITMIYKNKENPILKSASIDFMIFILIGLILMCFSMFEITNSKKTKICCLILYIFKNIGFSLVYGSMLVKTYRIYLIFMVKTKIKRYIKKKSMILTVFGICMMHLFSVFFWIIINAQVFTIKSTNDHKIYSECTYPSSVYLCEIVNMLVAVTGCGLCYTLRGIDKKFRENMTVPLYTYVLFELIKQIYGEINSTSNMVYDLINSFGISINIMVTIYYVYLTKFLKMNLKLEMLKSESTDIKKSSNSDLIQMKTGSSQTLEQK